MNKSQRIYLDSGTTTDNHIKVQLEQNIDTLEFLSMSINTKDAYLNFNADYGVLVGRVIANGGIGVPNAKISIFIPIVDEDVANGEINSIYPYKTPRDKNNEGKRYNLLPRVGKIDPITGVVSPKQPFGSFPVKEELVTNELYMDVYKKYYKYTALTNSSGDYMIFGVPIGTQTVHLSVDITDIGKYSMNAASMVTMGYSPNLFTNNNTKIKSSPDLNDLPNIETQEISVNIVPFWGDSSIFEIGITRQDFRIRATLVNTFVIFGSAFTDGDDAVWGSSDITGERISELFIMRNPRPFNRSMASKRVGNVTEKIYYYPVEVKDEDIDAGTVDPTKKMILLDPSEYSSYKQNGDFVFIINCNRNRVLTDEFGNPTRISDTSTSGIFTQFRGFMTLEITPESLKLPVSGDISSRTTLDPFRYIYKFPQTSPAGQSFVIDDGSIPDVSQNINWRKEDKIFSGGTIYSVAKFHGTTYNDMNQNNDSQFPLTSNKFFDHTVINKPYGQDMNFNVGVIQTGSGDGIDESSQFEFPSNSFAKDTTANTNTIPVFGANWMNFSIYFPQVGWISKGYAYINDVRHNDNFHPNYDGFNEYNLYFVQNNTQAIAAGQVNTKWFARSDLHWTDFVEVSKGDIIKMKKIIPKGFTSNALSGLTGTYRNGNTLCPYDGGKLNGDPNVAIDPKIYFYKGLNTANCIEYLISLGLV